MDLERFLRVFIQICDGLSEAHSKGIVHCDIKPGNIIIGTETSKDGEKELPKLIDFGIARVNPRDTAFEQQATMDFAVTGSPRYMSPEQCVAGVVDDRSDIYSLGCVMYEAVTGRAVFEDISDI